MQRLTGKSAVVTGGGSGIGQAVCRLFAEEGAEVVVAEINQAAAEETARDIRQRGGRAMAVATDVADEASVRRMVDEALKAFGKINLLVNNAAVFVFRSIDATPEDWRKVLDVNVMGPALVAKHVVPEIRKQGGGAIVNIGSMSSFIAQPNFVTYNTSKAAIANLTRCMALDLAPDNIRVNAVCPGTVWTPQVQRMCLERGLTREQADKDPFFGGGHMITRIAEPVEIARAVLFLASDEASFITAENLMVDGGYTAK